MIRLWFYTKIDWDEKEKTYGCTVDIRKRNFAVHG